MKFIADVMVGKLAKRMRLLGFDVLYDHRLKDNEIICIALEQGRIIVTRDTGLASRPLAQNSILIASNRIDEQLHQVLEKAPSPSEAILTRCSACNTPLTATVKENIRDQVPNHVIEQHREFLRCDTCGRIYWKGTHIRNMERILKLK